MLLDRSQRKALENSKIQMLRIVRTAQQRAHEVAAALRFAAFLPNR
jgi:hypothetical protein